MRETETHIYFWGGYLSNFWKAPVKINFTDPKPSSNITTIDDAIFKSSEQAYMAFKAVYFNDNDAFMKIFDAPDPKTAKAIGRMVNNFDPVIWDSVSYDYMLTVCTAKFTQNKNLAGQLRATGDKILVEASPLDKIWGVGLHFDDDLILDEKNWLGQNLLGKVLMEVRALSLKTP